VGLHSDPKLPSTARNKAPVHGQAKHSLAKVSGAAAKRIVPSCAALHGAASVAGTTEAMVAEVPRKQAAAPAMPGGGMDF